jgi:hypothetical protein
MSSNRSLAISSIFSACMIQEKGAQMLRDEMVAPSR